jgi:hypothetical protein
MNEEVLAYWGAKRKKERKRSIEYSCFSNMYLPV